MTSLYRFLLLMLFLHICISADPLGDSHTEFNSTSKISANIGQLLAKLVSRTPSTGFATTSSGKGEDKVYGLSQCRGNVSSPDCSNCVQDTAKQIRQHCPNQADARIWYDYCFLRYSQENFFSKVDRGVGIYDVNFEYVTKPEDFNMKLEKLMDKISSKAVVLKRKGFGKDESKLSAFLTLYASVQCTRDLAPVSVWL